MRYIALVMSAQMGQDVLQVLNGAHRTDPRARVDSLAKDLATHGTLTASLKIPNTTGPLNITADLKAGQVLCSTSVKAPEDKGPRGRVGWLVRQLKEAPDDLQLESRAHRAKSGPLALLGAVREDSK